MANPLSPPPGNPTGQVSRSTMLPILSNPAQLWSKGYLIPGAVTVVATIALLGAANLNDFDSFVRAFAYYVTFLQCLVVYLLCGRRQLWWMMLALFVIGYLLMFSPIFMLMAPAFKIGALVVLKSSSDLIVRFVGYFFTVGLLEELYKALPLLALAAISIYLLKASVITALPRSIGLTEPLDGIALGVAAGAAFAILETLGQYVPDVMHIQQIAETAKTNPDLAKAMFDLSKGPGLQLLIIRLISQTAGHLAWSGYFGYFIGLAVLRVRQAPLLLLIGLVTAAALHGAWDATSDSLPTLSAVIGTLSFAFLVAAILKARKISPTRAQNFATVVVPQIAPAVAGRNVPPQVSPTPAPKAAPAVGALVLKIGPMTRALTAGLQIEPRLLGSAGAGRGKGPIAEIAVDSSGNLGLRNLSNRSYRAKLPAGKTIEVSMGQIVRLSPGVVIDFGGVEAAVQAR